MAHQHPTPCLYLDDKLEECTAPPPPMRDPDFPRHSLDTPGASSSTARLHPPPAARLSIHVPPPDARIPNSKFSPESPPRSTFRARMSRAVFELRTSPKGKEPLLPMQTLHLVEKHSPRLRSVHDRRKRAWRLLLIALLLFLLANALFLDVRVVSPAPAPRTTAPDGLSALESHCLTSFAIDAPAAPLSYPCATCLPIIQSAPASALAATGAQTLQNAQQFCGLKSFFDAANSAGQSCFRGWGWFADVGFCAWQNVGCDTAGRVSSLQVHSPPQFRLILTVI